MRIVIFMEDYFCGGIDTFIINLINNWPYVSDELILICNRKHSGLKLLQESITRPSKLIKHNMLIFTGLLEHPYKKQVVDYIMDFILKLFSPVLRYILFIYNIFALKKILLRVNPDRILVVNNGYPAGDSCRAATISWGLFSKKPRSIHNFHGIALMPGWHIRLQEYIVDILLSRFSKMFISVSRAAAESLSSRDYIYKNSKVSYIYNGVGISNHNREIDSRNLKSELGIPNVSQLCLMLGQYYSHKNFNKGHYFLFRAFEKVISQIPAAHLLVCGYGSSEDINRIRQLVLRFNMEKNIHLSGFRSDVSFLLRHTDILLISSQAFESFCLVSIEAMAHYVPVVATKVGAIPEIVINGQGGYCVDKDDVDTYAKYIIKLLKDENLRKEQGQKGFQRYKEFFTAERMAAEYAKLIHNG